MKARTNLNSPASSIHSSLATHSNHSNIPVRNTETASKHANLNRAKEGGQHTRSKGGSRSRFEFPNLRNSQLSSIEKSEATFGARNNSALGDTLTLPGKPMLAFSSNRSSFQSTRPSNSDLEEIGDE